MSTSEIDLFHFGTIIGTHGLKGDLKVRPLSRESTALCQAGEVFLRAADGSEISVVPVRTAVHKGNILLRLEGYENIDLVTEFAGRDVLMRRSDLPELDETENYWQDLQGIEIVDRRCGHLGTLEDMFTTAAHDIYVVQGPFGEVLIPVVTQFICDVDIAGNRMTVDLPEGLVPESDED